jgi:NADP-reducing hydrogenase subunit HndD
MVNLKINNVPVTVPAGTTIIEAAKQAKIEIPSLCYLKGLNAIGSCRICVVEVKGARALAAACVYPVAEGMEVFTNTKKVRDSRKMTLELILSNHEQNCLSCERSQTCELQRLAQEYGCDSHKFEGKNIEHEVEVTPYLVRDNNKCIVCRRCVAACAKTQGVHAIGPNNRGFKTHIACAFEQDLNDIACVACGQCIVACPVGALREKDDTDKVWDAIADPNKKVFISVAPAVRATLGECFGMPIGTNVEKKIPGAIRFMGADGAFDINISADLTILEEGTEFIGRVKNGGKLPMITSCSPGWIKFCEHFYPEFIDNLSSCKSPQQMHGALLKTYYAEKMGWDPKDIFVVNVFTCTAKKFELTRDDQSAAGVPDVDVNLTVNEFAKMIKSSGINFAELPDSEFDNPFGIATGAAVIFGVTGGVMEAALRTVAEVLTKKELESVDFTDVRGLEGVKEATYNVAGIEVKVAVASGLSNARALLDAVKSGEKTYHFIEIMGCPGGCINGGGQPIVPDAIRNSIDVRELRSKALYDQDAGMKLRKSHESPVVKALYEEYFKEPNSHKAHHVLHTSYVKRDRF